MRENLKVFGIGIPLALIIGGLVGLYLWYRLPQ